MASHDQIATALTRPQVERLASALGAARWGKWLVCRSPHDWLALPPTCDTGEHYCPECYSLFSDDSELLNPPTRPTFVSTDSPFVVPDPGDAQAAPPERVRGEACPFAGCKGTMTRTRATRVLGPLDNSACLSDGSVHTVGTARDGWTCDRHPEHVRADAGSRSEIVPSRMADD